MVSLLIINNHSFIDTITNSSTELFVCDTNKSLEVVRNGLILLIDTYNQLNDSHYTFEDMFDEPIIGDGSDDDADEEWGYGIENTKGKILVRGSDDNSVPYELWEMIDRAFDAQHYHLG